jgi:hypothetical protein
MKVKMRLIAKGISYTKICTSKNQVSKFYRDAALLCGIWNKGIPYVIQESNLELTEARH